VLSHMESTVVSGPMAWFLMRNESRFLFSHDHAYTMQHSMVFSVMCGSLNSCFAHSCIDLVVPLAGSDTSSICVVLHGVADMD
jgi:hypothetical protein